MTRIINVVVTVVEVSIIVIMINACFMDTNKLIQKIPFYSQLSISEKQILLSGFTIRTYIKSEYILDFADAALVHDM